MPSTRQNKRPRIAVIGGGTCTDDQADLAREVGAELARRDCVIITGGLGGVMAAACAGAKSVSGLTVGILPGFSAQEANEHVDLPIVTGLSHARNTLVVRSADAVIAVGGQYGTLSEIALSLAMGIPVVGLDSWEIDGMKQAETAGQAVEVVLRLIAERS
jgi:uncharacterized protein (TIGR00725 family)